MATTSDILTEQLAQFGTSQLDELNPRDISGSTIHLILATAFFTGATIHLCKPLRISKKDYLKTLTQFLEIKLGISNKNARGSVESNARLYKRYILIEKCFNHGWVSAQSWANRETNTEDSLKSLLNKYQQLAMSNLSIEGVKEDFAASQPIIKIEEPIVEVEPPPVKIRPPAKPGHTGRYVFWLVFIGWSAIVAYFALHLEQIPPEIHTILQRILTEIQNTGLSI